MTFTKEIRKLLKEAESKNFKIKSCKSRAIKVYSGTNRTEMYTLHPGDAGVRPLKQFIKKNS